MASFRNVVGCVAGLVLAAATTIGAQEAAANRFTSPADVTAGARLFRSHCTTCHGRSGRGDRGPDLAQGVFRHAATDTALFRVIRVGVPGTDMPGLYMGDRAIWQLVAFVRSLGAHTPPANLGGDPVAGEQIFRDREDCTTCHVVAGAGGRGGPDLSDIGWRRSPSHLRTSLLEPNAEVAPRWWSVRLVDRSGRIVTGLRMNEDTYSVRLLDADDRLRAFQKQDLREFKRLETSPMGSYEDVLSEQQLDDLVAYLSSLRRKGR